MAALVALETMVVCESLKPAWRLWALPAPPPEAAGASCHGRTFKEPFAHAREVSWGGRATCIHWHALYCLCPHMRQARSRLCGCV